MRARGSAVLRAPSAAAALAALSALSAALAAVSALSLTLAALSALSAPAAADASALDPSPLYALSDNYCDQLQENLGGGPERRDVILPLVLWGGGAAAAAAHALLRALLVRGVRVPAGNVTLRPDARGDALCPFLEDMANLTKDWNSDIMELPLTLAAAWRGEPCATWSDTARCAQNFHEGLGGNHMDVDAGRAPVARRLFARRAAAAPPAAACATWSDLRSAKCLFLAPYNERPFGEVTPPSDWPSCTRSVIWRNRTCIPVLVAVDAHDGDATARLAGELCARFAAALPGAQLRLAPVSDASLRRALRHHDRSFLFVDYDWWDSAEAERVQPAPPLCAGGTGACAPLGYESAVPMLVAPVKKIKYYLPFALGVLAKFRPAPVTLRRALRNAPELGRDEAACEALLRVPPPQVADWISCRENDVVVYVQTCGEQMYALKENITDVVFEHWIRKGTTKINVSLYFADAVKCNDTETRNDQFEKWSRNWMFSQAAGAVALGDGGAGLLPAALAGHHIPLLLGDAPEHGDCHTQGADGRAAGACAVSPSGARLLAALRWLLGRCGWARAAVLRDEGRACKWQNYSAAIDNETALVLHHQILGPGSPAPALAALRARRSRVVVVDADAAAAAAVLEAAQRAGMTPAAGYAWLVLRAAGEGADWRPGAAFEYVTLSGWWRGGAAPGGAPALQAALLNATRFPRLPPMTAPLVDALLMMLTGIDYMLDRIPTARYDRTKESRLLLLEHLNKTSVNGVAQQLSCGDAALVFVHRWRVNDTQLVATWPPDAARAAPAPPALCEPVRDAALCHTTSSGDAYTPTCHDVAWVVCLCALVLAPPALCAAASARRARLRRRDRAVEQRLLARAWRSEAAAAALAEHAVPRAALELLDELGAGHYGSVRLAVLRAPDRPPLAVAAKTPRADAAAEAAAELLREAALLAALRHDHVVRLAGVCFEGAPLVLMEHAFHGDLRRYLRARRPALERARAGLAEPEAEHVGAAALTRLAREAAAALGYLAHHRLVHRDVRAANCLVDARRALKLADFGLARRLDAAGEAGGGTGAGEYLCRRRALFPVLWMAPESLERGVFSPATDVWGLGVLMLELATLGARPFGAWPAPRVLGHVRAGGAPPLPRDAAASTRGVAATCWRRAAAERPSAAELVAYLATHPRALRPALAPLEGDAGAAPSPDDPDKSFYCEEWTT